MAGPRESFCSRSWMRAARAYVREAAIHRPEICIDWYTYLNAKRRAVKPFTIGRYKILLQCTHPVVILCRSGQEPEQKKASFRPKRSEGPESKNATTGTEVRLADSALF